MIDSKDIDRVSLEQALVDVDIANARVIDLTERLTTLTKELRTSEDLRHKCQLSEQQLQQEVARLSVLERSRAVRLLRLLARMKRSIIK
jgi:hypothetical protein